MSYRYVPISLLVKYVFHEEYVSSKYRIKEKTSIIEFTTVNNKQRKISLTPAVIVEKTTSKKNGLFK